MEINQTNNNEGKVNNAISKEEDVEQVVKVDRPTQCSREHGHWGDPASSEGFCYCRALRKDKDGKIYLTRKGQFL